MGGSITVGQQGCSPLESASVRYLASLDSFASEIAFKSTAYPVLRQNCAACHDTITSPFFAAADSSTAFFYAIGKVDLTNPANSRIVQRMGESHNCWSDCAQNAAALTQAIQQWSDLAKESEDDNTVTGVALGALTVPANLPTGNNFTQLSFPLNGVIKTLPANAAMVVDIQDFVGDYRVRHPRLVNVDVPLKIQDIKFLINDKYRDTESTFTIVDGVFGAAGGGTYTILNTTMIVLKENGPGLDLIKPLFKTLTVGP